MSPSRPWRCRECGVELPVPDRAPTLRTNRSTAPSIGGERERDPAWQEARRLRNKAAYRRFVAWFRQGHPLCVYCEREGLTVPMQQVHHRRGLAAHPEDWIDEQQCEPVCTKHHAELSAKERT